MKEQINLIHGDCLELMKSIPSGSVDMILCDLPYGTTACKWDSVIPFEPLWEQYKRIIKDNGAIVLTASQPFTSALVMSNLKMFRYEWIWEKDNGTNFPSVNFQPFRVHENVLVFGKFQITFNKNGVYNYNPQKTTGKSYMCTSGNQKHDTIREGSSASKGNYLTINNGDRYPRSVQKFNRDKNKIHPTQKPVALFEYLIKTYTNEGDLVMDNTMGSGTTGVACVNTNRRFLGMEKDDKYFEIAKKRIEEAKIVKSSLLFKYP
jgi:site-specific DNA-methyltransferase (adenine-specific)